MPKVHRRSKAVRGYDWGQMPPANDTSPAAYENRQKIEIARLKLAMERVEDMLRHPTDPFVMVNAANFLNQERLRADKGG